MCVDLHTHTTASDGTLSAPSLVEAALAAGIRTLAITDHDSVEAIEGALLAARDTGLEIVPGVELSAQAAHAHDVHVLGYFIDHRDRTLLDALAGLRRLRLERAREMVDALVLDGHDVTLDGVLVHAGDGAVGRSHVARALVDAGSVESVETAFRELIGRGRPFFVEKMLLTGADAVGLIRAAGGVAVLAHPGITHSDAAIPALVAAGLGGLEAFHAEHTRSDRDRYSGLAQRMGLLATGGSDYHGPGTKNNALGSGGCPPGVVDALRDRATISRP
ncbi:MAG: PHP domain-containing protein [Coriobacteriia bacterium]|nr:PHP domain-containing protein [Coriobacteriia bacterium]